MLLGRLVCPSVVMQNHIGSGTVATRDDSTTFFAHRKPWVAVWLVFLSIMFVFGWHKSVENAREAQALREWEVEQAELSKDGQAEWNRFIARLDALQAKPGSQKALENELNGGAPFELQPLEPGESRNNETRKIFSWTHPKYGAKYSFYFDDGVLVGRSANWGGVPETLHPRPTLRARSNTADRIRRRIASAGVYTWLAAFVVWIVVSRRRLVAAHVMLAAALASGMAWLVNPAYTITGRGVFSNDNLFWAALMIVISVYLLAVTLSVHAKTELEVPRVRFGLRQLLLAVTVAAILLAAGPFGFVAFNVAVGGMLLFMLVYHHYRSRLESAA